MNQTDQMLVAGLQDKVAFLDTVIAESKRRDSREPHDIQALKSAEQERADAIAIIAEIEAGDCA